MVSFDHRDAGTPEEDWLVSPRWQSVPGLVFAQPRALIVISAHPDDESLGCAGLMARATSEGIPVTVIVATNGDASHPSSPTTSPAQLAIRRRSELLRAVASVAPTATVEFLELPDGRLRAHSAELQERIAAVVTDEGCLIVAPWRGDSHGDHEAAGNAASAVARDSGAQLLEYPIWMWHWAAPSDEVVPWNRFVTLQLTAEELQAKGVAIASHVSQNAPLSERVGDEVLLDEAFHEYFLRPFEVFISPLGSRTLTKDYFDDFYQGKDDPWGFETRWYEIRKRALTVASLPRPLFASGLEIGCSIGVLTAELAGRCASLIATDIAEQPLERARVRLIEESHVQVVRASTPGEWPEGTFDLIVLSEVGYYWSPEDLQTAIRLMDTSLTDDGVVVACHWRHPVDGYPERGDSVHRALRAYPGWSLLSEHIEEDFLLDVFVRPPALSVAGQSGML